MFGGIYLDFILLAIGEENNYLPNVFGSGVIGDCYGMILLESFGIDL